MDGLQTLMEAQLLEFKKFLGQFLSKVPKLEEKLAKGEKLSRKEKGTLKKMKEEYETFMYFFEEYDGYYWGKNLSVLDYTDIIKQEVLGEKLSSFKTLLGKYNEIDAEIEACFMSGNFPTEAQEAEFEKMKEDYEAFMTFFKEVDKKFWGGFSVLEYVNRIKEEAAFPA